MKTFWIYAAILFLGMAMGIIIGVVIDKDTVFKGNVRIKQRGKGNTQAPEIIANLGEKLQSRKEKRLAKKQARIERRLKKND